MHGRMPSAASMPPGPGREVEPVAGLSSRAKEDQVQANHVDRADRARAPAPEVADADRTRPSGCKAEGGAAWGQTRSLIKGKED